MSSSCLAPGDRTHIPESALPIYNVLTEQLVQLKQTIPVRVPFLCARFGARDNVLTMYIASAKAHG